MNPPPLPKKRGGRGLLVTVIVLGVLLGLSALMNLSMMMARAAGSGHASYGRGGMDQFPELTERWSYGFGEVKAVRIPLQGVIVRREEAGLFGGYVDKVRQVKHQIAAATNDQNVQCIILEVDSPGGAVTPSDELYTSLMNFKQSRSDRKVIAFTRDLAASGGYYAAMSADWIIAEPTSIVGSIGVIMQTLNWKKLTDDIGIHDVTIKSGENKDMLNPFRETEEAELVLLQTMIDTMHTRFKSIVGKSRNLSDSVLDELADGRVFTADQALDNGLIDQIGYWEDTAAYTAELLGVDSVRFIRYQRQGDLFSLFSQAEAPWPTRSLLDMQTPSMMYLWRP